MSPNQRLHLSQLSDVDETCYLLQNFPFQSSAIPLTHLAQSPATESGVSWVGAERQGGQSQCPGRGGGVGTSELGRELSRGTGCKAEPLATKIRHGRRERKRKKLFILDKGETWQLL